MFRPAGSAPNSSNYVKATPIPSDLTSPTDIFNSLQNAKSEPEKPAPTENVSEEDTEETAPEAATDSESVAAETEETTDDSSEEQETPAAQSAQGVVTVKGNGKEHQFKLDPNDKDLQKTLSWGVVAPKLAAERKAFKKENEALKEKLSSLEGSSHFSEAKALAEAGYMESAFKQAFGEDLYKKFFNEAVIARLDYENATPEERIAIDRKRFEQEKAEYQWKLDRSKGVSQQADAKTAEAQAKAKEVEMEGYAKAAIAKHDFASLDKDKSAQEIYKVKVYRGALDDIQEWVEAHKAAGRSVTPTQAHIEKAIARNYSLLTGARKNGKNDTAKSSASDKKAAAKVATKNYDKGTGEDLKGLSPLAIFNKLRGQ